MFPRPPQVVKLVGRGREDDQGCVIECDGQPDVRADSRPEAERLWQSALDAMRTPFRIVLGSVVWEG